MDAPTRADWQVQVRFYESLIGEHHWRQEPMLDFVNWLARSEFATWIHPSNSHEELGLSTVGNYSDRLRRPMVYLRFVNPEFGFDFDVHAMIFSEDAPGLENALHKHFDKKRVNLVNTRREFFHVSISEMEEFVQARGHKVEITKLAEARQYRETVALREKARAAAPAPQAAALTRFPDRLDSASS